MPRARVPCVRCESRVCCGGRPVHTQSALLLLVHYGWSPVSGSLAFPGCHSQARLDCLGRRDRKALLPPFFPGLPSPILPACAAWLSHETHPRPRSHPHPHPRTSHLSRPQAYSVLARRPPQPRGSLCHVQLGSRCELLERGTRILSTRSRFPIVRPCRRRCTQRSRNRCCSRCRRFLDLNPRGPTTYTHRLVGANLSSTPAQDARYQYLAFWLSGIPHRYLSDPTPLIPTTARRQFVPRNRRDEPADHAQGTAL